MALCGGEKGEYMTSEIFANLKPQTTTSHQ